MTTSIPGPELPQVLSVRGVSKAFGAVQALSGVSVDCRAGEVHALVGENGSGKSTLLGIASGSVAPDDGRVEIGGRALVRHTPAAARRLGVGIPYQDYSHVLGLSVAENLLLAVPPDVRPAYRRMEQWAAETLATFKLDIAASATAASLSLADRQLLEVGKALLTHPKVLLLDEPTTALGPDAVEQLHTLVLEQVQAGVGVLYVSHRLPEVLAVADRVTVLRDGVGQGTFDAAKVSEDALVALMIGRPLTVAFPNRDPLPEKAEVVLDCPACRATGSARSTSSSARARSSALRAPRGTARCRSCQPRRYRTGDRRRVLRRRPIRPRSPAGPLRAGVVLFSGDRRGEALFPC